MKCPRCQHPNLDTATFCSNCGNRLPTAEYQAPATEQSPVRRSEGERKLVTVLFADVVGSTSMAESLDPEEVADIMNGAFAFLNAAVARYGGIVARLMGDAILSFFGAPVAHEDDPERAVRAGLEIQEAAKEYASQVKRTYGLDFSVRVGINSGLAVLDMVGDQIKTEYTAMGDTTNVASRLQTAATPGTVLISADTYRFVRNLFDFKPPREIEVKGKSAPLEVHEVLSSRVGPAGYPWGAMRGLDGLSSPLIGRDADLGLLREKLGDLHRGRGALVAIVGEAGIGKSRLLSEARTIENEEPQPGNKAAWLEGRAVSYGQALSYYPWRQIIRQAIGAREGDAPARVREKLKSECTTNCCNMPGGDAPFLEIMLAVESEETLRQVTGMAGDALVGYITDAVKGYICEGLAATRPTVLVFDDLHWADHASLDLLLSVSELVREKPLLFICLLRPDKDAPSWELTEHARKNLGEYYSEVDLEPLSSEESRRLLGNLLHIEDLPDSVRNVILNKAEGNPFFVEEVIRSLIDSGYIALENGHWRATQAITGAAIPDTLAGILTSRIDRLPADTKRVTQAASVVGRIFAERVLKSICESAPPAERIERLEPHLEVLSYEELVRESARNPELEYMFKHALTQEAAYNSLLIKRRKEYHRRTADVLESLYPDRLDELAPTLALHYWHAGEWERAADYSMRAGAAAAKIYAMRGAIEHYRRAIDALDKMPDAPLAMLYDALVGWVQAASRYSSYQEILVQAERAVDIARAIGDKRRLVEALHWMANTHLSRGRTSRGMPVLMESFALVEELGDERLSVLPRFARAYFMLDSEPRMAIEELTQVIELANKYGDRDLEATALGIKAMIAARLGEFQQAEQAADSALQLVAELNSPMTETDVDLFAGFSYLDMGDADRGLEYGQRAVDKALSTDRIECICNGFVCVGFGLLQHQQLPEAIEAFEESIRRSTASGATQIEYMGRTGLAVAELMSGRTGAVQEMETTLDSAKSLGDPYIIAFLSQWLGEGHAQLDGSNEGAQRAEGYLEAALDYYRRAGMNPYAVRALHSLASIYGRQGRDEDASRALAEAEELSKGLQFPEESGIAGT